VGPVSIRPTPVQEPNRPPGSDEESEGRPKAALLIGHKPWLGVGELRNNVKLLHHSERVPVGVLLDHLAVF